jgi:hypothetical protein
VCRRCRERQADRDVLLSSIAYDNPFTYDNSIFIGFNLAAEWSVFIALGWNLPPKCLDLSFEFKQQTNEKMKRDRETSFVDPSPETGPRL